MAKVEIWEREGADGKEQQLAVLRKELATVTECINRVNAAFTEGSFEFAEFREIKNPLIVLKAELEAKIAAVAKKNPDRLEPLRNWISEANALENTLSDENWPEMKKFLQKVG